jgi:PEP-CTERM motif
LKLRIALLAILCLGLASVPAWAQWSYDNGPINGTTDAWTINFGYIVSDTYIAGGSNVTNFSFGVWEFPGDTMTSVDWSITSGENSGTVFGSGTASGANLTDTFISTNQFGYDIDKISVTGLNVPELSGVLYWLNLQNAAVPSGDPVFWDENSGVGCGGSGCPSSASESAVGTIASEAFTIGGGTGGTTPEPSSIMLFGSGILGLAGVLRRKLF